MRTPTGRIAPTPSGYLHRGNLLNFTTNREMVGPDGQLYLRIDDLDRGRYRKAYEDDIDRTLEKLKFSFVAKVRQSERIALYEAQLERLRGHPLVFACPCSRKELATGGHVHGCLAGKVSLEQAGVAWRVATVDLAPVTFTDVDGTVHRITLHDVACDFSIRDKQGRPTYQLACTIDDFEMGINTLARGRDLLPSTAAQTVVAGMLGWPGLGARMRLLHHALILDEEGRKLSKSAGRRALR